MIFSIFGHNFVSNGWDLINLILNILPWCGCVREVLHNRGVISFGFQNVNEFFFSVRSHKSASKRRYFMKLIQSTYDYSVVMSVKVHENVFRCREVIAL